MNISYIEYRYTNNKWIYNISKMNNKVSEVKLYMYDVKIKIL